MQSDIKNKQLRVSVKHQGAELCSLLGADGTEYLWQADPAIWGRHAPILFPIVGALKDGVYTHDGTCYRMGQHGFARDKRFELVEQTDNMLAFRLVPDDDTRASYPFEFVLEVRYVLDGPSLAVTYQVINQDEGVLPFSIGAHPGFATTWGPDDVLEDYYVEFERAEVADSYLLDDDHLLSASSERVLDGERVIRLTRTLFDRDALIFKSLASKRIALKSDRHDRVVSVSFGGFPDLGIWAKPGAPYVCIEPWYGHVDPADHDGVLIHKPGIITLEPGADFTCEHRISLASGGGGFPQLG